MMNLLSVSSLLLPTIGDGCQLIGFFSCLIHRAGFPCRLITYRNPIGELHDLFSCAALVNHQEYLIHVKPPLPGYARRPAPDQNRAWTYTIAVSSDSLSVMPRPFNSAMSASSVLITTLT